MALIKCPECGKEISDQAPQCPNCGRPVAVQYNQSNVQQAMPQSAPYAQQYQQVPPNNQTAQGGKKKNSTLSIWAAVLGFFTCTAYIGGIIAIIDLIKNKNDGKKHIGSWFALVMCVFVTIIFVSSVGKPDKRMSEENGAHIKTQETQQPQQTQSEEDKQNISDQEITFQDTEWGTSFDEVDKQFGEYDLIKYSGDHIVTPSVDAILLDNDYKGIDFEYGDINIVASALKQTEIAGYKTTEIQGVVFYFAYPIEEDQLLKESSKCMLYGAKYNFDTLNLQEMANDLKEKIISIYGEPYETYSDTDMWGCEYTHIHWLGQNDTELMMTLLDASKDTTGIYDDKITIAYAWRGGDELLQKASDLLKEQAISEEREQYGNDNTSGL